MSERTKKSPAEISAFESEISTHPGKSSLKRDSRKIRKISPLGFRVVVRITKDNDMTDAGLYLPEGSKHSMQDSVLAEVVEVASAVDDDTHEEANVSGIPLGATVLIPKDAGISVPWDEELRIVETKLILALVDEVHLT